MTKKSFTLIELIFVVVIVAFLSVATFKALQAIVVRSYKAKETTRLSLESQMVANQISELLKDRVPATVIGYYPDSHNFEYIGDLTSQQHPPRVLEWIRRAKEAYLNRDYSGFIDLKKSDKDSNRIFSPDTNGSKIDSDIKNKFNTNSDIYNQNLVNLIFAGSFDRGSSDISDYNNSFGWHGHDSNNSFDISIDDDGNITITDKVQPKFIYEKYFLVDSAYAIARKADLNATDWHCSSDLNWSDLSDNTLLLFYNYRPWKGETFCADNNGTREGNVTILMKNVSGFRFDEKDYTIRISLDINKSIKGSSPIHLSKMKVVF